MDTPWGESQYEDMITEGVYWVDTAGHGGVLVHEIVAPVLLSTPAREIVWHWGEWYAYEEDCAWAIFAYEQPKIYAESCNRHGGIPMTTEKIKQEAQECIALFYPAYHLAHIEKKEEQHTMENQKNDTTPSTTDKELPFTHVTYTLELIGPGSILSNGELTISDMELLVREKKCISRCDYYNEEPLTGPEVVALMKLESYDAYSDFAEPSDLGLNEDGSPILKPYIVTIPYHYYRQFRVDAPNAEVAKEMAHRGDVPHYSEDHYPNNEIADVEEA